MSECNWFESTALNVDPDLFKWYNSYNLNVQLVCISYEWELGEHVNIDYVKLSLENSRHLQINYKGKQKTLYDSNDLCLGGFGL